MSRRGGGCPSSGDAFTKCAGCFRFGTMRSCAATGRLCSWVVESMHALAEKGDKQTLCSCDHATHAGHATGHSCLFNRRPRSME
jgi:hypothetical protein